MANPDHLKVLREGVAAWNDWREQNEGVVPDLSGANLCGADLTQANLFMANLSGAELIEANLLVANLSRANLHRANLYRANLSGAKLVEANLSESALGWAHLRLADLSHAKLTGAKLTGTRLAGAKLIEADLVEANLSETDLTGADLHGALFRNTSLCSTDLSEVKGLEAAIHQGPTSIGIDTFLRSKGKISETFLRGAGVPDTFIQYAASLAGTAFEFYSCFISYSSKDEALAQRLHADLQAKGVRCWFAPEDLKIGDKIRVKIDEAVRLYDKLLLLLSRDSVNSDWVRDEVESALEKEREQKGTVLFPVRLDNAVMEAAGDWPAVIRRSRHIGDFTQWEDHSWYKTAFERLLRDLKAKPAEAQSG